MIAARFAALSVHASYAQIENESPALIRTQNSDSCRKTRPSDRPAGDHKQCPPRPVLGAETPVGNRAAAEAQALGQLHLLPYTGGPVKRTFAEMDQYQRFRDWVDELTENCDNDLSDRATSLLAGKKSISPAREPRVAHWR